MKTENNADICPCNSTGFEHDIQKTNITKTMNVTKPYSPFVGPGYSFSVLGDFKSM